MFNLNTDEKELLFSLTPYPRAYAPEFENSLNYFNTIQLASNHRGLWAKGAKTDIAISFYKQQPSKIYTCKNCGG